MTRDVEDLTFKPFDKTNLKSLPLIGKTVIINGQTFPSDHLRWEDEIFEAYRYTRVIKVKHLVLSAPVKSAEMAGMVVA